MMKTRTTIEDVSGNLNRRYYAEVEVPATVTSGATLEVDLRRSGDSCAEAARRVVNALRYLADDAERKFVESGVLPEVKKPLSHERQDVMALVSRAGKGDPDPDPYGRISDSVREALYLLVEIANGRARIT